KAVVGNVGAVVTKLGELAKQAAEALSTGLSKLGKNAKEGAVRKLQAAKAELEKAASSLKNLTKDTFVGITSWIKSTFGEGEDKAKAAVAKLKDVQDLTEVPNVEQVPHLDNVSTWRDWLPSDETINKSILVTAGA